MRCRPWPFLFLASCGGGGGDSGSVAGASGSISLSVDVTSIPADGSSSAIIRAVVTDSAGNPVRNFTDVTFTTTLGRFRNGGPTYTVQTQPPLNDVGWPDTSAPPTGVVETALIAGTKAGSAKVTVRSNNATQTIYISITGAGAAISLVASPSSIPADGVSSSVITATVVNSTGSPVTPGTEVLFMTGLGTFPNGGKSYAVLTPDSTGVVSISLLAGVVPGTNYVLAKTSEVTQAATIVFTNTYLSTLNVTANPSTIPADGVSTSIVTATVMNVSSNIARQVPVSGVPITFYDAASSNVPTPLPDNNTWRGNGDNLHVTPDFYSYSGSTTFTFTYSGSNVTTLTVRLYNRDTGKLETTLINKEGPFTNEAVSITMGAGNYYFQVDAQAAWEIIVAGSIGPAQVGNPKVLQVSRTDAMGNAYYTFTSTTTAGVYSIKAETGQSTTSDNKESLNDTVDITVTGNAAAKVELPDQPLQIYANGENYTTIKATVTDIYGNTVADGTVVNFYTNLGSIENTAMTVNGIASAKLTSVLSSTTLTATVTARIGNQSDSAIVYFLGISLSDMTATPSTIISNGVDKSTITVRLKNDSGVAIENETVIFSTTNGSLSSSIGLTDASGIASVELTAPVVAGTGVVTAKYGLATQTVSVVFTSSTVVGSITLTASPEKIPADGASSSTITATIKDAVSVPVPKGTAVVFATTLGTFSNGSTTYTVITPDGSGVVSVSLKAGSTSGSAMVTATSNGVMQAVYVTIGNASISIALVASPTSIPADGVSSSKITATLTDSTGNPVAQGTAVTFSTTMGKFSNGQVEYSIQTMDANGIVVVSLISSKTAGSALVNAQSNGVSQGVFVEFTGGTPGVPASLSLAISKTSVKSDNSDSSTVTATVLDSDKAVIEGATIAFMASGGQLSKASAVTDANGRATTVFSSGTTDRSNRIVTITATVTGLGPQEIPIQIVGSTLSVSTDASTLPVNGSVALLTITGRDAGNNAVYNTPITLSQSGTGTVTLSPLSGNTNVAGQMVVSVTGASRRYSDRDRHRPGNHCRSGLCH